MRSFLLCRCLGLFCAHVASFHFIFLLLYVNFCITICHLLALLPSFRCFPLVYFPLFSGHWGLFPFFVFVVVFCLGLAFRCLCGELSCSVVTIFLIFCWFFCLPIRRDVFFASSCRSVYVFVIASCRCCFWNVFRI